MKELVWQVTYRFVSVLNEQGFLEGRYVPVIDGQKEATPAAVAQATAPLGLSNGDGSTGETDVPSSEPALKSE